MILHQFLSKVKELQFKRIYVLYIAYLLACISVIVQINLEAHVLAIYSSLFIIGALMLRVVIRFLDKRMKTQPEKKTTNWKELRNQLTQVLSESKILIDSAIELKSEEISSVILSEKQVNGNFFKENEELIKTTRIIGINGLLCLMFLIQQQPTIASVRAIQKSLKIPLASAYRHLQRLSDNQLVTTYYLAQKPSKVLYKITDDGSSVIIRLYELIGGSLLPIYEDSRNKIEAEI